LASRFALPSLRCRHSSAGGLKVPPWLREIVSRMQITNGCFRGKMWDTIADAIKNGNYSMVNPVWREKYCREDKKSDWIADGIVSVTLVAASTELPQFVVETKVHATYDRHTQDFTVKSGYSDVGQYIFDIIISGSIIKNFTAPTDDELNNVVSSAAKIVDDWAMGEFYGFCAGTKITAVLRRYADSGLGKIQKKQTVHEL